MPSCAILTGKFSPPHPEGYRSPFGWLSVPNGEVESLRAKTLIDSGAGVTMIELGYAEDMLNMTERQIKEDCTRKIPMEPVGGVKSWIYGWRTDFRLRAADDARQDYLEFNNAWVFVTDRTINGYPVLLGQLDGLHEKWFGHYNHSKYGQWQIK